MFPKVRPDAPVQPLTKPEAAQPDDKGPSEFTRFFDTPLRPAETGNQWQPSGMPQQVQPLGSPGTRPGKQPGEFTQMFGTPNRPDARGPSPSVPPLGPALGSGGASATGAFSFPQTPIQPPPNSSGPGEFTRMMSVNATPTLGQPPAQPNAQPGAQPLAPPKAKSMVPLYIAGGAVLLAIILIIVFLMLRRG